MVWLSPLASSNLQTSTLRRLVLRNGDLSLSGLGGLSWGLNQIQKLKSQP